MHKQNPLRLLLLSLLLALAFSAAFHLTAFADEGTPTDPAPTEEAAQTDSDGGEAELVSDATLEPTPVSDETVTNDELADVVIAESLTSDETAVTATDTESTPSSVPVGIEIVVLDESGAAISLASEEAAEIITGGDPLWCPVGVAPVEGMGGCTTSFTSLEALFSDLESSPKTVAGVIWIEDTYSDAVDAWLDGSLVGIMNTLSLTIKGGWTGSGTTIGSTPSTLNHALYITAWQANITLSDITITGESNSIALEIFTTKDINLTRVKVDNNTISNVAAYLDNCDSVGGVCSFAGNVLIKDSSFSQNTNSGGGLLVWAGGTITLSNVTASNDKYGILLDNEDSVTAKNITLSGVNDFNNNYYTGIDINSKGLITLNNVMASGNGVSASAGYGAYITNTASTTAQGVTLTGTNIFNSNYEYGLFLMTKGPVKISKLIANSNLNATGALAGAYINNNGATTGQPVTISGSGEFAYNGDTGIQVLSNGVVTLNNITASNNSTYGVSINNSGLNLPLAVTLTGTNLFNFNGYYGLNVYSYGPIAVNNITALDNGQSFAASGVYLSNEDAATAQKVTVSGVNKINENSYDGLTVRSAGAISISSVTANDNGYIGVKVDNESFSSSPQPVTISGINVFNGNGGKGMDVISSGAIKVNSVTANDNGEYGARLHNSSTGSSGSITLTGTNQFNGNHNDGLVINSRGAVSMNNITANTNGISGSSGSGVAVNNWYGGTSSPQNVTLTGTNTLNGNYHSGMTVVTYGAVSLSNITANSNGIVSSNGRGLFVGNTGGTIVKGVTLSGTNTFDNNHFGGLLIQSIGAIKLNSTTVTNTVYANGSGAELLNNTSPSAQGVTITGTNVFNNNLGTGLNVVSLGAVSLNNVTASFNGTGTNGFGVAIDNSGATSAMKVTITGLNAFNSNKSTGLDIHSKGAVSLQNITASNSVNSAGLYVSNWYTGFASTVTLGGTNTFADNKLEGLAITSYGAITLNNVTSTGNDSYGAQLVNASAETPQKVALTGTNSFSDNGNEGLQISTRGPVSSTLKLTASGNTGNGVLIENCIYDLGSNSCQGLGGVTFLGTNIFESNSGNGLVINVNGAITIGKLTASSNGGYGASLDNCNNEGSGCAATSTFNVTLTGANTFNGNLIGLAVLTSGATSLSNVTANDNTNNEGVTVASFTLGKAVIFSGTNNFNGNFGDGLEINSEGPITLNNVTAVGNDGKGVRLINNNASTAQAIKLTGTNYFADNGLQNLTIDSAGSISLNNVTSIGGWGMGLDNTYGTAGVTLTGTNFFLNATSGSTGLSITSYGAVTLNKITADGNTGSGVLIQNATTVTVVCGSFTNNTVNGLDVTASGVITLKGLTASGNGSTDIDTNTPPVVSRSC